ncbi:bestrophin family protein [Rhizobium leucaenae]|uniref:Putative membrane protein n=1 Tax=Rhizobium leucaenae TaxID=29450 RepID=A0A7W6ZQ49_9HYPH|nr:bestrophin family protein [Rhizobium leucaenae]MBB4566693.1 putative membrane protein [Rhizobium leucaenae]MBB6301412.1 putative membrane protein [Rhizobium leucaenae]
MIVRDRPNLFQLFFIVRGSVIRRILPQIVVIFLLSALIVWGHEERPNVFLSFNGSPFALLGIALSIFLGFRNNACYDRWWEGRRVWGQLVYVGRSLARQTLILESAGENNRQVRGNLLRLTMAFTQALVCHLRPGGNENKVLSHLSPSEADFYHIAQNRPDLLLRLMSADLARLKAAGDISDIEYQMLDASIGQMGAVQAACERIRNTPLPFGYTLLLHRTAYLFCFLLPFGFVDTLGWGSPFVAALVAYTFFGLDALGDELEDPFSNRPNALAIGALADTIEINLREALGEADLPPMPQPKDFVLM